MNISEIQCFVANGEAFPPRTTALEQRICIGTGFHNKWYRSQREHWLGWLEFQRRRAILLGKEQEPAVAIWNRFKCSPAMLWMAEVAGVSPLLLKEAEMAAEDAARINSKDGNPHGRLMRQTLPWSVVVTAVATKGRKPLAEATKDSEAAFGRLASLRSEFRRYLEIPSI